MSKHPTPEKLDEYAGRLLDEEQRAEIARHIESCPQCGETVENSQRLTSLLRAGLTSADDEATTSDCLPASMLADYVDGLLSPERKFAAEQHLAEAATGAEAYLRLRVAALLLGGQIEAYRKANQGPVLRRAAEIFARLTLGSFKGLRDDLDAKGQPVLFGVRPDDKEVPVAGMSDGTGDQLFLALRLATLEQHLAKGEPMPFIVDDILVGFDDQRSQACLEVLGELAAKTQVLLFTHHSRIRELAEGVRAPAGVFVHDLTRP